MLARALVCALLYGAWAILTAPLFAAGEAEDVEPPTDERTHYRVGFVEFQVEELATEFDYLRWSLPLLLYENTLVIGAHRLSADEIAAYRATLLDRVRVAEGMALDSALESRDALLFTEEPTSTFARMRESAEQAVASAQSRLAMLDALPLDTIEIASEKPIERHIRGQQRALARDAQSLSDIARQEDLDLVVSGAIDQAGEFLFVEAELYNALTDRYERPLQLVGTFEEINMLFLEIQNEIAEALLGGEWASIAIRGIDTDTKVYIDDRLVGYGEQTISYIRPGIHSVRAVSSIPQQELNQSLFLVAGRRQTVSFALIPPAAETMRIESSPPGAAVYINSTWAGHHTGRYCPAGRTQHAGHS